MTAVTAAISINERATRPRILAADPVSRLRRDPTAEMRLVNASVKVRPASVHSASSVLLAAIHRAMRADAATFTVKLGSLEQEVRPNGRRLLEAFARIAALVECHHHSEGDSLFPSSPSGRRRSLVPSSPIRGPSIRP